MMKTKPWTPDEIPDQSGKTVLITGANSGLGYESTLALAAKGAHVIMACRNQQKAEAAKQKILEQVADAALDVLPLDLASQASIRSAAETILEKHQQLDLLLNNAGVMALPHRTLTPEGFEMQFGTNHLGHFALTGRLMPLLLATPASRIVTTSSLALLGGWIDFANLNGEKYYQRWIAYCQSKLANLLFGLELAKRLEGKGPLSLIAHPGYTHTELQNTMQGPLDKVFLTLTDRFWKHTPRQGAAPQLYAGTMPGVRSGQFWGPAQWGLGYPAIGWIPPTTQNRALASRLWHVSEQLTHLNYA
jgi:NAD(P)-dependent dehydrogenase (short-subunit alcohol dehydrogenase family)